MTSKEIDERIEAMIIAKIATYRLNIRMQFKKRHEAAWLELAYGTITGDIRTLKVWLRMAEIIDEAQYRMPKNPITPYTTYKAKQLTHDTTRP